VVIVAAFVGLGLYVFVGDRETAAWICAIALLISVVLAPITATVFSKSGRRKPPLPSAMTEHYDRQSSVNQRRHRRHPVTFIATFSNEEQSGFGVLADISAGGCRLMTKLRIHPGDSGKLLIDLPTSATGVRIASAVVRWVTASQCGIEFITIGHAERRFLEQAITTMANAGNGQPAEVSTMKSANVKNA
jgi:hypothetical protein